MSNATLSDLMRVSHNKQSILEWDPQPPIESFLTSAKTKRHVAFKKQQSTQHPMLDAPPPLLSTQWSVCVGALSTYSVSTQWSVCMGALSTYSMSTQWSVCMGALSTYSVSTQWLVCMGALSTYSMSTQWSVCVGALSTYSVSTQWSVSCIDRCVHKVATQGLPDQPTKWIPCSNSPLCLNKPLVVLLAIQWAQN